MTTQEFKTIAIENLNKLTTIDLIAELKKLNDTFTTGADLIYDVCLDILMNRLPEDEFTLLCDSL